MRFCHTRSGKRGQRSFSGLSWLLDVIHFTVVSVTQRRQLRASGAARGGVARSPAATTFGKASVLHDWKVMASGCVHISPM